jgi:hypothetical protein
MPSSVMPPMTIHAVCRWIERIEGIEPTPGIAEARWLRQLVREGYVDLGAIRVRILTPAVIAALGMSVGTRGYVLREDAVIVERLTPAPPLTIQFSPYVNRRNRREYRHVCSRNQTLAERYG